MLILTGLCCVGFSQSGYLNLISTYLDALLFPAGLGDNNDEKSLELNLNVIPIENG